MLRTLLALICGAVGIAAALRAPQAPQVLILSGDYNGNLAPCGCTKPMTGGIKRLVSAAVSLRDKAHTTLLDNGGWVLGAGRQDALKADALAEILGKAGWTAVNVGPREEKLGKGELLSMQSLSQGKLLASVQNGPSFNDPDLKFQRFVISGPFFVLGVSMPTEKSWIDAVLEEGIAQARETGLSPVLLLQGSFAEAKALAVRFPDLRLIQYRSGGDASERPTRVGNTLLVTPGADGKHLLRLVFFAGKFKDFRVITLGPEFSDDPQAARIYRAYLSRVSDERLVEAIPRFSTESFAGSRTCQKCHQPAGHVWERSHHAQALRTLERFGHDRDPDCLPCHVVGLSSKNGFNSRTSTPQLAGVGCESCHGSGGLHAKSPSTVKMPKVASAACVNCHTGNTSPGFEFSTYWQRVRH